jgi:hypothetical protein
MRDRAILRMVYLILSAIFLAACAVDATPGEGPLGETREAVCSAVTLTSAPSSAAAAGSNVVWTANATCQFTNPELEFWVLDPIAGTYSVAAPYSSATTTTWQVPSVPDGTVYEWQVWAREAGSTADYEAWAGASFTVETQPCTSVTMTVSPSFVAAGAPITLNSSAAGCASPEYEVWVLPPGGSYQLLQPYATSASYVWNAPATPLGVYTFQVWARQSGSSASYETWDTFNFPVNADPTVSATTLPVGAASVGAQVTITSSSTGLPTP